MGQKPSTETLKELNAPLVPSLDKERSKGSGVRMKNVGSPKGEDHDSF